MRRTVQIVAIVSALKVSARTLALDARVVLAERRSRAARKDHASMGWQRFQTVVGAVGK